MGVALPSFAGAGAFAAGSGRYAGGGCPPAAVPSGVEIGIIVGSRDSKVSESSTRLGTECDRVVIDSAHAFMMNKPEAQRLILNFLDFGCFEPDKIGKK